MLLLAIGVSESRCRIVVINLLLDILGPLLPLPPFQHLVSTLSTTLPLHLHRTLPFLIEGPIQVQC